MQIIEKAEHQEQFTITDLEKGEVFRLPSAATVYIKIGASDTAYNNVNLANGVLGTISENYAGLLKVKGAFVENYKVEDDVDSVKEQLAAKSEQCHELFDAVQSLKNDCWTLEKQIKEQKKQLAENQKTIEKLKAERDQLQFMSDSIQNSYAVLEKNYQNDIHDSNTLFKQIIDATYLGEMKGWEDEIIGNPQRLIEKIRNLANTVKQLHDENTSE